MVVARNCPGSYLPQAKVTGHSTLLWGLAIRRERYEQTSISGIWEAFEIVSARSDLPCDVASVQHARPELKFDFQRDFLFPLPFHPFFYLRDETSMITLTGNIRTEYYNTILHCEKCLEI